MRAINHFNLRNFDLNLLVAFDALLQELSVTAAATRLHIQQPAMSHSLATLRLLLDDALFVRTGSKMEPTPRALALRQPVREILQRAQETLMSRERFEPSAASGTFRIGINVQPEMMLLPLLMDELQSQAPGMRVVTSAVTRQTVFKMLDEGEIDLAIGYLPGGHAWHHREQIYIDSHSCCYRRATLGRKGPISLQEYEQLPQGFVSARGSPLGYLEEPLTMASIRPTAVLSTPNPMTLAATAANSPIIITISMIVARRYCPMFGLELSALPFELPPMSIDTIWHSRTAGDPATEWLRAKISAIGSGPAFRSVSRRRPAAVPHQRGPD